MEVVVMLMKKKYSLNIGLILLLLIVSFSYAFTGYKTGANIDRYYLFSGIWNGSNWSINVQMLKSIRNPGVGLLSKPEETLDIVKILGYSPNLPPAPNEKLDWYMRDATDKTNKRKSLFNFINNGSINQKPIVNNQKPINNGSINQKPIVNTSLDNVSYANSLNSILSVISKEILEKRKDTSSRVVIDLAITTADNQRVHYVASYDGRTGYRSYGFQPEVRQKSLAIFAYYSKNVDTVFPQPPEGTQLIGRSDIQNKLGKYDYVIYGPSGSILAMEKDIPGSESYEYADEVGIENFINSVVIPKMGQYDVDISIVKYMHAIRPTLDANGEYQFRVEVPYRHVSTNCPDINLGLGPGYYVESMDQCEVPYRYCYTETDSQGKSYTVCEIRYEHFAAYVKTMSEVIHYEYNTEADFKIYEVKRDGSFNYIGQKTEPGVFVSFNYSKQVSPGGYYSPRYFMDKIISIRKDRNDILPYTEEPVEKIANLSID
jgi:hypothetical protein